MTLSDAGPMVALLSENDQNHARCVAVLPSLSTPLVTTWPCIAEAMYFLGKNGGQHAQDKLWQLLEDGTIQIHVNDETEREQMRALIRKYSDLPMDLADASLVAAATTLEQNRIFTIDSDFRVYRLPGGATFEVVP